MSIVAAGLGRPGQGAIVARGLGISVLEPEVIPPHVGVDLDEPALTERAQSVEVIERSMEAELEALITEVELGEATQILELADRASAAEVLDRSITAETGGQQVNVDLGSFVTAVVFGERVVELEVVDRSLTVEVQPILLSQELGSTSTRRE